MKTQKLLTPCSVAICLALGMVQNVSAALITDNYWGAGGGSYGDIVGNSRFEVYDATIERRANDMLSVSIRTNFVNNVGTFTSSTNTTLSASRGIGFGDLFLASSWNPVGNDADHYIGDDASNGTQWTHGVSLDNRWSTTGGNGNLYSLTGDRTDNGYLFSDDFLSSGISSYRNGQEVAVDTSSSYASFRSAGNWSVDRDATVISFLIDVGGTGLETGDIALRWAMTCANDVIEGIANGADIPRIQTERDSPAPPPAVPEPATIWLMGLGLAGLSGFARRKKT